ncbi:MAG: glycosyltransferase family 2 protein [Candidatus Margulisbacteria bacterium]|nr:glycosyltransferase family 2 protein [Candidatus Margulisiibacteriota bacterium]
MVIIKVIDKLLEKKRRLVINRRGGKNALLSYVLVPPPQLPVGTQYYVSHNSKMLCRHMIRVLVKFGYKVHLQHYLDTRVETGTHYDLFIGHNITFSRIAKAINPDAKKILLVTGASPQFENEQLKARSDNLYQRKGVRIEYEPSAADYIDLNFETADRVFHIGGDFVKNTWPARYHHKMWGYRNITPFKPVRKTKASGNFIYAGSFKLLRRGLDLLLEIFYRRKENIYVYASYKGEDKFVAAYHQELFETKNIRSMGFVNLAGRQFRRVVDDVDFVVYPTSAEGQSTTVLYLMSLGVLPIVTENCGFENIERIGFKIEDGTLAAVAAAVNCAVAAGPGLIEQKRRALAEEMKRYTPDSFEENFADFLNSAVPAHCLDPRFSTTRRLAAGEGSGRVSRDGKKTSGGLRTRGYHKKAGRGKPVVSIITVVFNGEKYLEETINSVLSQSYDNVEYVIIDGGSRDGTLDIIRKYEHAIDYWVSEPDKGLYDALNKGIDLISGSIFAALHSDDVYYDRSVLARVAGQFSDEPGLSWLFGNFGVIGADSVERGIYKIPGYDRKSLYYANFCYVPHPASFFKRDLIKTVGKFDLDYKLASDYDFFLRLGGDVKGKNVNYPLVKFRFHSARLSESQAERSRAERIRIQERHAQKDGPLMRSFYSLSIYLRLRLLNLDYYFKRALNSALRR